MYTGKVTGPQSLGRILQQARMLSGKTQRQLAEELGISQRYVWEIEDGKPSLSTERFFAYIRATGVSLQATVEPQWSGDG